GVEDAPAILDLYPRAFPDEDLTGLVRALLALPGVLSLIATDGRAVLGHVTFTPCGVADGEGAAVLLGPLAISPDRQRQGLGAALVQEGVRRLAASGATQVQVLGDPAYYGRFGFEPDPDLAPPYAIPEEWRDAWRRLRLGDAPPLAGVLAVPAPWRRPELWAG
ncbi:MAG: N-acetyltransferase, partial [Alphaproteobacteria bacterium]